MTSTRWMCAAILVLTGGAARAADHGSAHDARAMLDRAVAAIRASEATALTAFNSGANGFRDRDLYVFCATADGRVDAHVDRSQLGRRLQDLYDVDGVAFGQEMIAVSQPGVVRAVAYMWPRPGSSDPAQKVAFVTRVADQVCGVGYYK